MKFHGVYAKTLKTIYLPTIIIGNNTNNINQNLIAKII